MKLFWDLKYGNKLGKENHWTTAVEDSRGEKRRNYFILARKKKLWEVVWIHHYKLRKYQSQ